MTHQAGSLPALKSRPTMQVTAFDRFAGLCAILAGIAIFCYAIAFVVIARRAPELGGLLSALFLLLSGLLATPPWTAVYARLRLTEPGPGAIHFPRRLDADYFRQLTAERVVTRFERGRPICSWQPKRDGERNEALDTFVYAHAALHGLISMGLRLNEEVDAVTAAGRKGEAPVTKPARAPVIRSAWMR